MRLPISKVYRAFPELDQFDDARCMAYISTVNRAEGWRGRLVLAAHLVLGVLSAIVTAAGVVAAARFMDARFGLRDRAWARSDGILVLSLFLFLGLPLAVGGIVSLMLRDGRLRRLIARQLDGSKCPVCSYLLLGLAPREGAIRCPECGTGFALAELGLTEEQLISRRTG